jgi:hypothetical protein
MVMALRVAVAVLLALLALPTPLEAQGFWQFLFGKGTPPPPSRSQPGSSLPPSPGPASPYRGLSAPWPYPGSPFSPYAPEPEFAPAPYVQSGTYRTMCVRLCDGFYFPISNAVPGSSLARDADACAASCTSEARLFYYPNGGGDVEGMVDLTGMAYAALPNAFRYRKALVEGCRCRPQPWADSERARHRAYAQGGAPVAPVAGAASSRPQAPIALTPAPRLPAADGERMLVRPQPVPRYVEPWQPPWPFNDGGYGTGRSRYMWRP